MAITIDQLDQGKAFCFLFLRISFSFYFFQFVSSVDTVQLIPHLILDFLLVFPCASPPFSAQPPFLPAPLRSDFLIPLN